MFMKILKGQFFILLVLLLGSCTSQKRMAYFREVTSESADSINRHFTVNVVPKLKTGDQLLITVTAVDPEAAAPFNLPAMTYLRAGTEQVATTQSLQYYEIDEVGDIRFPVIGDIHLAGLTKEEATNLIAEKLQPLLRDPLVTIRYINFNVTVMGEVARPGKYTFSNERVTLLEALGTAGDLTPYGKRNNVLVTRENNGKLEFARINLNDASVFTSPYYYLQQNDVVYVEPNKVRAMSSQNISLYLSMITTLASMATVIVSVTNAAK